jgi:NTP pyrophosphatase (non-canonical NTP hydrolase)
MKEIEKAVVFWQKETFPTSTIIGVDEKLGEEISELFVAWEKGTDIDIEEEFADCCIVFITRQAKGKRKPLSQLISEKMEINRKRKWNHDGSREK